MDFHVPRDVRRRYLEDSLVEPWCYTASSSSCQMINILKTERPE